MWNDRLKSAGKNSRFGRLQHEKEERLEAAEEASERNLDVDRVVSVLEERGVSSFVIHRVPGRLEVRVPSRFLDSLRDALHTDSCCVTLIGLDGEVE